MAPSAPTDLVTFVLTDVQSSTPLWEQFPNVMAAAIVQHNDTLRRTLRECNGYEVNTEGDAFFVAFSSPVDAARWCLEAQRALLRTKWPSELLSSEHAVERTASDGSAIYRGLRVRMGIHLGTPTSQIDPMTERMNYVGPVVNRAMRICNAGHGGQIVMSAAARKVIEPALSELGDPLIEDLGEHRLRGLDSIEQLFQLTAPELAARTFPPLRTLDARKTNLVTHPAAFVGREGDLEHLRRWLIDEDERLITLLGPGGTGKTRLAMQFADKHLDHFSGAGGGGIWFCDLAAARGVDAICSAVAGVLGLPLSGSTAAENVEQLGRAIAGRGRVLIVLDNFEQIVGFGPDSVAPWLAAAPESRFLVTSQALLRLPGEIAHDVSPLPDAEGVELFEQRARAARPGFELSDVERSAVTEIVRRLDGLPLAIELAAARVKLFNPGKLLERLSKRFDLLKGGHRDADARQSTLRGAIEWSWSLLTPWEQDALAQCSVFHGGFTLEAAEEILDLTSYPDAPWPPDVVQELRERSLLRTYEPAEFPGDVRFGMYSSIHDFVSERLSTQHVVRAKHTQYYLEHFKELTTPRERALEIDNIVEVHDRGRETIPRTNESVTIALRAALAADPVLSTRGPFATRMRVLDLLDEVDSMPIDRELLTAVFITRARARLDRGLLKLARLDLDRGLELARTSAQRELEAEALAELGRVYEAQGRSGDALSQLESALEIFQQLGASASEGRALVNIGASHHRAGDKTKARGYYERALVLCESTGDQRTSAICLTNLGGICLDLGETEAAQGHYQQAMQLQRQIGNRPGEARVLGALGSAWQDDGDGERARDCYVQAIRVLHDAGDLRWEGIFRAYLGASHEEDRDRGSAKKEYAEARALLDKVGDRWHLAYVMCLSGPEYFEEARALIADLDDSDLSEVLRLRELHFRGETSNDSDASADSDIDRSVEIRMVLRMSEAGTGQPE